MIKITSYEFFCSLQEYDLKEVMICFVEEFKNYTNVSRYAVLKDEPIRYRGSREQRAFYASLCEFYCNWYHLKTPCWVNKDEYFLHYDYFPFCDGDTTLVCKERTPLEFKKRNIYIGESDVVIY